MTSRPLHLTRAGILGTVLVLLAAAGCVRLGLWQLDRLGQRRARNAAMEARLGAPPAPLTGPVSDTTGLLYRPLEVAGEFDHARSVALAGKALGGSPGVYIVTPLRMGGRALLVNRGFVRSPDAATVDLARFDEPAGPVRLRVLALPLADLAARPGRPAPGRTSNDESFRGAWFSLDPARLPARFPYPIEPIYGRALPEPGAPALPVRLPPPDLGEGSHLSYAIQWFCFGAIAVIGWIVLMVRHGEVGRRPRGWG